MFNTTKIHMKTFTCDNNIEHPVWKVYTSTLIEGKWVDSVKEDCFCSCTHEDKNQLTMFDEKGSNN